MTQAGRDEPAQETEQVQGSERAARQLDPDEVEAGLYATPDESTPGEAVQFGEDGAVIGDTASVRESGGDDR